MQITKYANYCFKKGKKTTETLENICVVYEKGAVTDRPCQSGFQSFMLQISWWTMLHGWVDQVRLIAIKLRH